MVCPPPAPGLLKRREAPAGLEVPAVPRVEEAPAVLVGLVVERPTRC